MDRLVELQGLFWQSTLETLYIVGITLAFGGVGGLLIGVALYITRKNGLLANAPVSIALNLLVNFFRPIPFVIFIGAVQPLARLVVGIGIGNKAIIFALSLAAAFGIGRIVEQNLVGVDPGVIEAARAMGASRPRIIVGVLIPEALGPLILGYTFVFVALVDMSAIAGVIGGGGLGNFALVYGYRQFNPAVTWGAVIAIVVIVQVAQFAGNLLARKVLRR
ncbi:methionine ABC transporter permease [Umezawaea sp. NPDC059074]|uniref:methionine ABC transporter permease n=1 Tax=Umezawaea sp. NPDC059074 TaxID=3346716 RepID=UPI0036834031